MTEVATEPTVATPPETPQTQTPETPEKPADRWRPSLVVAFWTWLAALLMYCLVTAVSWLPFGTPPSLDKAYESWHRWDTTWYVIIADLGYGYDKRSAAFFPLYPMLIRGADQVLPRGAFEAALVVSLVACYAALVMVHRLATGILGSDGARRTVFYLLAFPTGFYLAAAYNESLFIALAAGSLYFMRRGQWWMAGVLGGFASGTRLVGVLLMLAFGYEYLRQRRFSPRRIRVDALAVALIPVGLLLYAAYCWRVFGDPLFFREMQGNWFRSGYQAPWTTLGEVIQMVVNTHPVLGGTSVRNIINLTTAVAVLALLLVALDREWGLGAEYAYLVIFSMGVILLPLINPIDADYPLSSMWRFALECLPVWLVLAKFGRNGHFDRAYTMVALALQGVMILTFVQNQFVA
jgi:Gpi18-like mannosyltransferase